MRRLIWRSNEATRWLITIVVVVAIGCPAWAQDYVIGPRDVIRIVVWGQADLAGVYTVSADGMILFPLVGPVEASGLTKNQLGQRLKTLLEKDYLVNPQVMVYVEEYRSKKVVVLGEVVKPGVYPLTGETSVLDIISQAIPTASAGKQIMLYMLKPREGLAMSGVGQNPAGERIRRLDLAKIQSSDPSENIAVEDGDTLIIPKAGANFWVFGEVTKPGGVTSEKLPITIIEAVTLAGGMTDKAKAAETKVVRKRSDGTEETISVDLSGVIPANREFKLREGDTVIVPRGNVFFIFGEVKRPGNFLLERGMTILEAIINAGGFTDRAAPSRTKVIRSTPKGQETIYVDMNEIIKKGRRNKSIPIQENDLIVVPESIF